jgi:hypothetical protein
MLYLAMLLLGALLVLASDQIEEQGVRTLVFIAVEAVFGATMVAAVYGLLRRSSRCCAQIKSRRTLEHSRTNCYRIAESGLVSRAGGCQRQRFADQVAGELAELRNDPEAWKAYLAEADSTSVSDGVG